jgi:hypothetical protein
MRWKMLKILKVTGITQEYDGRVYTLVKVVRNGSPCRHCAADPLCLSALSDKWHRCMEQGTGNSSFTHVWVVKDPVLLLIEDVERLGNQIS